MMNAAPFPDRRFRPRPFVVEKIYEAIGSGPIEHVGEVKSETWLVSYTGKRCKTIIVVRNTHNGREVRLSHGEARDYAPDGSFFSG